MALGLREKQYRKQHCDSYCRIKIVVVLLVRLSYETIYSCFCDAICYLLGPVFQEVPECTRCTPGTEIPLRISSQLKRVDIGFQDKRGPSPEFAPKIHNGEFVNHVLSGWWFQTFLGKCSHLTNIFHNGLKPPI